MTDAGVKTGQAKVDEEKAAALKAAEEQVAAADKKVAEIKAAEKASAEEVEKGAKETSPGLIEAPSAVSLEAQVGNLKELKKQEAVAKVEKEFADRPVPAASSSTVGAGKPAVKDDDYGSANKKRP